MAFKGCFSGEEIQEQRPGVKFTIPPDSGTHGTISAQYHARTTTLTTNSGNYELYEDFRHFQHLQGRRKDGGYVSL